MPRIPGAETPATSRSRHLRREILRSLKLVFDRQSAVGYSFDLVADAVGRESAVEWSAAEIQTALASLAGDGLIESRDGGFTLTLAGNGFFAAGCPWAKIDK